MQMLTKKKRRKREEGTERGQEYIGMSPTPRLVQQNLQDTGGGVRESLVASGVMISTWLKTAFLPKERLQCWAKNLCQAAWKSAQAGGTAAVVGEVLR